MPKQVDKDKMTDLIVKGLELAYARMVQYKRRINSPIVVAQNGKVVELDPFEAPDEERYR